MKESGKERLKQAIYESTRAPLTRFPFPDGEGLVVGIAAIWWKRISNIRREPTPSRYARQPLPLEGAAWRFECIYPSFLWKEVPAGRRLATQSGVKDDVRLSIFLGKR